MARIEWVEQRLRDWAQWLKVGDGSGYPHMSVLHPEWQPPSPGQTPTMKVAPSSSARSTHEAMACWSVSLRNTVLLYYVTDLPIAEQAARLGCAAQTVHARIEHAHRLLAQHFCLR